jgi:putative DNA primase/helicase
MQTQTIEQVAAGVNDQVDAERVKLSQEQKAATPSSVIIEALEDNEDGDARLFIEYNKGRFLYDVAAGRWYVWHNHYWKKDTLGEATRAIDGVIDIYAEESQRQAWQRLQNQKNGKTDEAKKHKDIEDTLLKRIKALQTVTRKENILTLARTGRDSLANPGDQWDQEPYLLPCLNGVINLKTGTLEPGNPDDYLKTVAPVDYQGIDTPAPVFEHFIFEIFDGNQDLILFIQKMFGYGITGLTNYHVFPIFHGPQGRNGKGTLLEVIKYVLGELAYKTRAETLLESRHSLQRGSADADTLAFKGKRIIWTSETSDTRKLNAARIKELNGGDTLNARAVYGRDPVEFAPTHLLILLTNERPQATASDAALWARILLIPFNVRFIDEPKGQNERKADHDLLNRLKAEAPGIMAWLVRGCLLWQREGLAPPEIVKAATREYQKEEDLIERFLNDRCIVGATYEIQASILYKVYHGWAEENGLKPMTGIKFGKEMQNRFDSYQKRHVFYTGLSLLGNE